MIWFGWGLWHINHCKLFNAKSSLNKYIKHIRGTFNKFPDFFRMGIENCRRLLKIQYVITIHLMRWLTNLYDFRFKWTATAAIGIHPTKAWLSQLVNFKNAFWTWEEWYAIKFCFKLGKNAMRWKLNLLLWPRDQETEFPVEACLALPDSRRPERERASPPTNFWWSLVLTSLVWSICTKFPLERQLTRNTMLRF